MTTSAAWETASRSPGWQPRARPTTTASTAAREALPALDRDGGRRLVVLADDGSTYVGLVCVSRDRTSLCVDAECHAGSADLPQATPG